jgi:hypothetical protein
MVMAKKIDKEESKKEGQKDRDHRLLGKHSVSDGNGDRCQMDHLPLDLDTRHHRCLENKGFVRRQG